MAGFVLSVCGIALLTVICEIILPDGSTKKYVRVALGVVTSLTIISAGGRLFSEFFTTNSEHSNSVAVQSNFVDSVNNRKFEYLKDDIAAVLSEHGIEDIEFEYLANEQAALITIPEGYDGAERVIIQDVCTKYLSQMEIRLIFH